MPTPDKTRPWVWHHCPVDGCDFESVAEWEWQRHLAETGHPWVVRGRNPRPEPTNESESSDG